MDAILAPSLTASLYFSAMALLGAWGLHRIVFLWHFRSRRTPARLTAVPSGLTGRTGGTGIDNSGDPPVEPLVTVQLPIYNERTVVRELIRAVGALDWPRERLEIQVLDDSTDETRALVDEEVAHLAARGLDAVTLRRTTRTGYKAGALDAGLRRARGELIAVFDADFTPPPGFLRALVGGFDDPTVGMVQARWGHRNRDASLLTRAQAVLLDGHFVIEHRVRHELGVFFNFNGTAGIWRRAAIESVGGWQHDTLTEDLDLSYRSQLGGWRFLYAPDEECPAELPPDVAAFKSQQHRWARGSVQVARKLLGRLVRSGEPVRTKLEAVAHLAGNSGYPLVLLLALLLPLSSTWSTRLPGPLHVGLFLCCTVSVFAFYDASQRALARRPAQRAVDVIGAVMLGIGLSLAQTRAVLGGLRRATGPFVRTAKRGNAPAAKRYRMSLGALPLGELALAAWMLAGAVGALRAGTWGTLPFLALFFASFAWVGGLSLRQWLAERGARGADAAAAATVSSTSRASA